MRHRTRTARRHRRVTVVAMGLSVAIHAAVLAFLRLSVAGTPAGDGAGLAPEEDRYLRQRPLQVVRLAAAPARRGAAPEAGASAKASSFRSPADGNAVPSPRLSPSASALHLRPVTGGGLENVVLASATASAAGSGADLNEGVDFEAASRAAKDASRERGRDRRGGRGSGIGITIVGPGSGSCDPSLLPGGGSIPTGILDDFTGRSGGGIRTGGDRPRTGGDAIQTGDWPRTGGDAIRIGGGVRPLSGGGIRIGGGRRF